MPRSDSEKSPALPSAVQLQRLVSDLENLNRRIIDVLADRRRSHEQHERDSESSDAGKIYASPMKPSELEAVKAMRYRLQKLDAQLKLVQDGEANLVNTKQLPNGYDSAKMQENLISSKSLERDNFDYSNRWPWPLAMDEYERYGRQLIMPEIGLQGQLCLKRSSVLIVGAGGLGCPAATYLAGAGVGTLGLMDGDVVELSNLHRQISHSTERVGWMKVDSAIYSLKAINPLVNYVAHATHLTPENSLEVFSQYDLILDCTDHPTSRYLISDAAVLLKKPLVSASALRVDGQLIVLNNPPKPAGDLSGGPCYRCVFPKPPPAESVVSCGEGGVLGPVVGVMGVLQALEAVKLIVSGKQCQQNNHNQTASASPNTSLLIYSAFSQQPFRNMRMRGRKPGCVACSADAAITEESLTSGSMDYVQFCGIMNPVEVLSPKDRITAAQYASERQDSKSEDSGILLDVRDKTQFELCSLPGSLNIPYTEIIGWRSADDGDALRKLVQDKQHIRVICRLGNDSQLVVKKIQELGIWTKEINQTQTLADIKGGLKAWKRDVDHDWPEY